MIDIGSARLGISVARHAAQEHEDHADHERQREKEGELHVAHRFADRLRAVVEDRQLDRRRQLRLERRQHLPDCVDHLDGVGAGLALNREHDAARAVVPGRDLVVLHAVEHAADLRRAAPARRCGRRRSAARTPRRC